MQTVRKKSEGGGTKKSKALVTQEVASAPLLLSESSECVVDERESITFPIFYFTGVVWETHRMRF